MSNVSIHWIYYTLSALRSEVLEGDLEIDNLGNTADTSDDVEADLKNNKIDTLGNTADTSDDVEADLNNYKIDTLGKIGETSVTAETDKK